jgi:hypothetical protein
MFPAGYAASARLVAVVGEYNDDVGAEQQHKTKTCLAAKTNKRQLGVGIFLPNSGNAPIGPIVTRPEA